MYTQLEDKRKADDILFYMSKNSGATIKNIVDSCYVNFHRLKQLEKDGYLKLPDPTPRGLRNKKYYEDKAIQQASA